MFVYHSIHVYRHEICSLHRKSRRSLISLTQGETLEKSLDVTQCNIVWHVSTVCYVYVTLFSNALLIRQERYVKKVLMYQQWIEKNSFNDYIIIYHSALFNHTRIKLNKYCLRNRYHFNLENAISAVWNHLPVMQVFTSPIGQKRSQWLPSNFTDQKR